MTLIKDILRRFWWQRGEQTAVPLSSIAQKAFDAVSGAIHTKDDAGAARYYVGGDAANVNTPWAFTKTVTVSALPTATPDNPSSLPAAEWDASRFAGKLILLYVSGAALAADRAADTCTVTPWFRIDDGSYVYEASVTLTHRKETVINCRYRPLLPQITAADNDGILYVAPL